MNPPFSAFLLIVFFIHLLVFLRLALRSNHGYQWMGVVTFVLLITGTIQRFWWPDLHLADRELFPLVQAAAWLASGVTLLLFLRHLWQKR